MPINKINQADYSAERNRMKSYLVKLNYEVMITADNKEKAIEEAQEIFADTVNVEWTAEEN